MQEWQRRRRHEQQKLRAMDKAFGGSMARLRAMYLEEEDHATEEENATEEGKRAGTHGGIEAGNVNRTGERSATPRR